jgi:hypothetical protein
MGSSFEDAASFRGAVRGVVCTSDSARGRFSVVSVGLVLTVGILVPFEGRAPSLLKGASDVEVEVGVGAGVFEILTFGFEPASTGAAVARVGIEEDEDAIFPPSVGVSFFGAVAPDSFSRRRLRI